MDVKQKDPGAEEDFDRCRRFVLFEAHATGSKAMDKQPPKYLAVHEWETSEAFDSPEFKATTETEWTTRVKANVTAFEWRRMALLRAWKKE
ncbi:hypothetical protein BN946_scf184707.g11 [Trametes cinnabarina]|uniref:Uncharacterized protein n=1 Tax=Pycnoporus cinnabarinus TaxID=5643 RepID=A0A060S2B5_PYCCI|nr:hypothetical protein BN946_scf184707.g11 [Trametes cinnabarina]